MVDFDTSILRKSFYTQHYASFILVIFLDVRSNRLIEILLLVETIKSNSIN